MCTYRLSARNRTDFSRKVLNRVRTDTENSIVDVDTKPAASKSTLLSTSALVLVFAALAVGLGAVAFAASDQASRMGDDAVLLREVEEMRVESTVLRSNVGISIVLASAVAEDVEVQEKPEAAVAASLASLERLEESAVDLVVQGGPPLSGLLETVRTTLEAAFEELDEPTDADRLARASFLPALDEFDGALAQEAATLSTRLEAESGSARTAAFVSSLAVGLLVPALAVFFFRSAAKRRANRALLAADLESERKLSDARDDLISGLSHELRNPLTGIYGYAEALRDMALAGDPDPYFAHEAATSIYREAVDLRRMVDDLLIAARVDTGSLVYHFGDVQVRDEVDAAAEPYVKRGDRIDIDCEPAIVRTDRLRLQHAIRNVVDNAVRHGGPLISLDGRSLGSSYRLVVSDSGSGVPDEIADRMFDRYIHRDSETGAARGIGMGLSVARTLMEGMGGFVEYRRVESHTVFVFEIPLAISSAERTPVAAD